MPKRQSKTRSAEFEKELGLDLKYIEDLHFIELEVIVRLG